MPRIPHVALFIESSRAYGRSLLQGVVRYQRTHGPWSIYFQPHDLDAPPPRWLKGWRGDGVLARINNRGMARAVLRTGLPAVDLRFSIPGLELPAVGIDNPAVVQLGFRHLADCGFKRFAFCGLPRKRNIWMDLRCDLFQKLVRASGHDCQVYEDSARASRLSWEEEQEGIADWVASLPKPIGVMACNDDRGSRSSTLAAGSTSSSQRKWP